MRRYSNLLCRHALALAALIFSAGCATDDGPPAVAAADGIPAKVILLTGPTADWFLDLDPPPPPDGRVVVAGNDQGDVFAFVLGRDTEDAERQLRDLRISGEVEGCQLGGVTCCDVQRKTYVLDSALAGERFWIGLGERCEGSPPRDGFDEGPPVDEANAGVVEVDPEVMSALAEFGVTHPFMTLAEQTGNGRILVDPSYETSDLGSPPPVHPPELQERLSIILAGHAASNRPECVSSVSWCKKDDGDRCNRDRRHWFRWNDVRESWCQMADRCRC